LYEIYNNSHEANSNLKNLLTLVDAKELTSREKIAHLIDTIYSMHPMGMAVDFIFPTPQDFHSDQILVETVRRVRDKTVFAFMLKDYQADVESFDNSLHSFFLNPTYKEWFCDSVMEGFANMQNNQTSDPVWKYSVVEKERENRVYSLPAMLIGKELFTDSIAHRSYIINYKQQQLDILSPDYLPFNSIKDHLVIIGSFEYSGDRFDTPLGLIPGMLVHSYIVQSINGDIITEQSSSGNMLMTSCALLLLLTVLLLVDLLAEYLSTKLKWKFCAMLLEGIFPSVFISIIAIILLKTYIYYLLINCNVFAHGQSAINGILVAAAIIKVIYTAVIHTLVRRKLLNRLTKNSIYSTFESDI